MERKINMGQIDLSYVHQEHYLRKSTESHNMWTLFQIIAR